jgi:hypothetical protein
MSYDLTDQKWDITVKLSEIKVKLSIVLDLKKQIVRFQINTMK